MIENPYGHVPGWESGLRFIIPDTGGIRQSIMQLYYLVMRAIAQLRCRQRIATMCTLLNEVVSPVKVRSSMLSEEPR